MAGKAPYKPQLIGDYEWDEVSSALNKMIRRNKEYEACFWAYIIHQSGYGLYLWRRLSLVSAEDVGNSSPMCQVMVDALASNWERMHKQTKEPTLAKLALVFQAIQYLCQAKKTREIDDLRNLIAQEYEHLGKRLEIPEIAKDCHTAVGRAKYGKFGDNDGREEERLRLWRAEWNVVEPEAYKGKYLEQLKAVEKEIIRRKEEKKE